jgi:hypothetical protein
MYAAIEGFFFFCRKGANKKYGWPVLQHSIQGLKNRRNSTKFTEIQWGRVGLDFKNVIEIRGNSIKVGENSVKFTDYREKSTDLTVSVNPDSIPSQLLAHTAAFHVDASFSF